MFFGLNQFSKKKKESMSKYYCTTVQSYNSSKGSWRPSLGQRKFKAKLRPEENAQSKTAHKYACERSRYLTKNKKVFLTAESDASWSAGHPSRYQIPTTFPIAKVIHETLFLKFSKLWEKGPPQGFEPRTSRGLPTAGIQSEFKLDVGKSYWENGEFKMNSRSDMWGFFW